MKPSIFPPDLAFEPVRTAVVGLGYWGPNLIRNLNDIESAELRWICDLDQSRLDTFGRRHPTVSCTRDFVDLLADPELEAIAIATPVSTHYPLALAALEAGKHVFIEKPLAASVTEAEKLATMAAECGLTLMPGHTFLYSPPVNLIRKLIADGELGDIYFISMSRVNLGLHQSDVSVAWDLGPHDFSILRYWLARTEHLVHEDWIPYRISLLGNYGTDLVLKREINRFLISEDPYGTVAFVRFGLERGELRDDLDIEMIVSIIDWMVERFQDALLTAELDPGLFRRQGELAEKKEARIQQFLAILQRAIGVHAPNGGRQRSRSKLR